MNKDTYLHYMIVKITDNHDYRSRVALLNDHLSAYASYEYVISIEAYADFLRWSPSTVPYITSIKNNYKKLKLKEFLT